MNTDRIDELLKGAADEIRNYVASQVEAWRTVPYWALESEGRGGWIDGWRLPYRYGLIGANSEWPHNLFIELCSGRLVYSCRDEVLDASDKSVLRAYLASPVKFDASKVVTRMVEMATNGQDSFDKERNDRERDKLRHQYNVPTVWTEPAKPIRYAF